MFSCSKASGIVFPGSQLFIKTIERDFIVQIIFDKNKK